ncbi:ABC transporter ATP-binding protein [Sphingomonas sp.]|uniref:ABC transporter ATP-binding protein n=1 Tax=Sphingomonas sp. TaxID=28214 RepID=UPI00286E3D01|nr:ABC transporter ATP-binding protein [Sphingomonas sp.]
MATVELRGVSKGFGATPVLRDVSLTVADGEFLVLVGPSGCGKSTLLRAIAGLDDVDSGDVLIGDQRVNDVPPAKRGIAMVFQSYALYPHMSLYDNMAFGLRLMGKDRAEIDGAVRDAANLLDIEHLLDRKPKALSGGQRQRVAIGRAIVRQPSVFLFDEPLSNLDAALRVRMRYEFAKLHQRLKTTTIYVTHDQVEAMTLADRIAILDRGKVQQIGTAEDLYERPATQFVAGFIGSPQMNFIAAKLGRSSGGTANVEIADGLTLKAAVDTASAQPGDSVMLGIRPEHLAVSKAPGAIPATVTLIEWLGNVRFAYITTAFSTDPLVMQLPPKLAIAEGDKVSISARPADCHLFDADGAAFPRASGTPGALAA